MNLFECRDFHFCVTRGNYSLYSIKKLKYFYKSSLRFKLSNESDKATLASFILVSSLEKQWRGKKEGDGWVV